MPYIDKDTRNELDRHIDTLAMLIRAGHSVSRDVETRGGSLNYVVTRLVCQVFAPDGKWSYRWVERATGCLECIKAEFYRRIAGPYEDQCIARNGDVREFKNFSSNSAPES